MPRRKSKIFTITKYERLMIVFSLIVLTIISLLFIGHRKRQQTGIIQSPYAPYEPKRAITPNPESNTNEFVRNPDIKHTYKDGIYTDPLFGYSLKVPIGWIVSDIEPGLFYTPDSEGLVGYADTKGMAIMVNVLQNDAQIPLADWFLQEDWKNYLVGYIQQINISKNDAILYEADWDTLGYAIGSLISNKNRIFRIDCFYPRNSTETKQKCQGVLLETLESLYFF